MVGLCCMASVIRRHGHDDAAAVAVTIRPDTRPDADDGAAADAPAAEAAPSPARSAPPRPAVAVAEAAPADPADEVDTHLTTGSIAPGSALHRPNPAAYADAAKAGPGLVVTGLEAINYLAGNTLRRDTPGQAPRFSYFASRGLMGEGDERSFTARRWERERPELCETGPAGETLCRSVSILLDGKYEFPGARLGTVTLGAVDGAGPTTAALIKGNAIHFPEHIPLLDSTVDVAAAPAAAGEASARPKGGDPFDAIVGHAAAATSEGGAKARQLVYYGRDNRRLELQPIQLGDAKAVQVTMGHWRMTKANLCQSRQLGEAAQTCFKVEAQAGGVLRLSPSGKTGEAQTLAPLPETGARDIAQD
jgi:hypothetical protein